MSSSVKKTKSKNLTTTKSTANPLDVSFQSSFRGIKKNNSKSRTPRRHKKNNEELFSMNNKGTNKIFEVWQGFFQTIYDFFLNAFQISVCAPLFFIFYLNYKLQPVNKPPVTADKHEATKSSNKS
jgi:hypothetical protein